MDSKPKNMKHKRVRLARIVNFLGMVTLSAFRATELLSLLPASFPAAACASLKLNRFVPSSWVSDDPSPNFFLEDDVDPPSSMPRSDELLEFVRWVLAISSESQCRSKACPEAHPTSFPLHLRINRTSAHTSQKTTKKRHTARIPST